MLLDPISDHPISALAKIISPPHTFDELSSLVEDIDRNGQLRPIVRDPKTGEIYHGVGRLKATQILGIEPFFTELEEGQDPWDLILSENAVGRQLDQNDKAMIGHFLSTGSPADWLGANLHRTITQQEASERLGVSIRMIKYAAKTFSTDIEELRRALLRRQVKVSDAAAVVNRPPEVQRRALDLVLQGKAKTLKSAAKKVEDQLSTETEESKRRALVTRPLSDTTIIRSADLSSLRRHVDRESVDVIVTFPPTADGWAQNFDYLGKLAVHALAPHGLMAILVNPHLVPEISAMLLRNASLQWITLFYYDCPGRPPRLPYPHSHRPRRLPILVIGKDKTRLPEVSDIVIEPSRDSSSGLTPLGLLDAGLQELVQRIAKPEQLLFDPVTLARRGTALGARSVGCKFIGAVDPKDADRYEARLRKDVGQEN